MSTELDLTRMKRAMSIAECAAQDMSETGIPAHQIAIGLAHEMQRQVRIAMPSEEAARKALSSAEDKARDAHTRLTEAQLQEAGIVIGKTLVDHNGGKWNSQTRMLVIDITYTGQGVLLAKAKKDGTPSKAGSGVWGSVSVANLAIHQPDGGDNA